MTYCKVKSHFLKSFVLQTVQRFDKHSVHHSSQIKMAKMSLEMAKFTYSREHLNINWVAFKW